MTTKKTIYLIRHGETDYNKNGIIQGSGVNSDLNENGHLQARLFYMAYKHIPFNKIYVSELNRTQQSIDLFIRSGIQHEVMPELNEINWGIMEGVMPNRINQMLYNQMVEDWKNGYLEKAIEKGESPVQLLNRQKSALQKIMEKREEETILICMHGRAIRSFLCLLLDVPLKQMEEFRHSNLCLYVLNYTSEGKFEISLENSTEHLW